MNLLNVIVLKTSASTIIIILIINIKLLPQTSHVSMYRHSFAAILWLQHMVHLRLFPILNNFYFHISNFPNNCAVSCMAAVHTSCISCLPGICWGNFWIFLKLFQLTLLLLESIIFKFHISCNPVVRSSYFKNFLLLSWIRISWNFHVYEQTSYFLITQIVKSGLMLRIVLWAFTCLFHNVVTLVSLLLSTNFGTSIYFLILLPFSCTWWSVVDHTLYHVA